MSAATISSTPISSISAEIMSSGTIRDASVCSIRLDTGLSAQTGALVRHRAELAHSRTRKYREHAPRIFAPVHVQGAAREESGARLAGPSRKHAERILRRRRIAKYRQQRQSHECN